MHQHGVVVFQYALGALKNDLQVQHLLQGARLQLGGDGKKNDRRQD